MIVDPNNISNYLPSVNFKVDNRKFVPFLKEAEIYVTDKIIGCDIADTLMENNKEMSELKNLVSRAICVKAYLDAVPELDLQLSEAGFVVASNEAFKPASKERVERLMQSLRQRLSSSLDNLLVFLIHNSKDDASPLSQWRGTRQFAWFAQTPVMSMAEFSQYSILRLEDWEKFYNAIPAMKKALDTTVAYYVSLEWITDVMERIRDVEPLYVTEAKALLYVKKAIVAELSDHKCHVRDYAILARRVMLANIEEFPIFRNSDSYQLPESSIEGTGGIANFL